MVQFWSNKIICHIIHIIYIYTNNISGTPNNEISMDVWFNMVQQPFSISGFWIEPIKKCVVFFSGELERSIGGCFFGHEICTCASVYVFYYTICSCFLFSETTKLTIRSFRRYLFYIMFLDLEVFQSISIYFPFWYTRWTSNFCFRRSVPFLHVFANHGSFNRVERKLGACPLGNPLWETQVSLI